MAAEDVAGAGASIIPVTDSQAEAITAVAQLGQVTVTESANFVRFLGSVFGDVPSNLVELLLGSHLRFAKFRNAEYYARRTAETLERRGVKPELVSPSLAVPLLEAAFEESRPELRELWAALIAAAMDPSRADRLRLGFIGTLKQFDPLDALLLQQLPTMPGNLEPIAAQFWANRLSKGLDAVLVSVANLHRLGCIEEIPQNRKQLPLTPYGRELLRACQD